MANYCNTKDCIDKFNLHKKNEISSPYTRELEFKELTNSQEKVVLETKNLQDLFSSNLVIPDYQRTYCWEDKNVTDFWDNLLEMPHNSDYHLGSIILQRRTVNDCTLYNIIDGQQRLVTLTLIMRELGYTGQMPLLKQKFISKDARLHVANNKALIRILNQRNTDIAMLERLSHHLIFSVLILNDSNLDLAYTFFSNQNSKGVSLSDYDLLKAHHLRYLNIEDQAEHLAMRWNDLSLEYDNNGDSYLTHTLGVHLFRLRKWMRKHNVEEFQPRKVKEEFSAARIMSSIPAFGEKFYFYEKIQGGSHFFAYTSIFVDKYKEFIRTRQIQLLRNHLQWESHWKYANIIESLMFGYFIKFGHQYLSEALFCIAGIMAQHRYSTTRAIFYKIREFAKDSEIIMMIDQASSPTFFLAETIPYIRISGLEQEGDIKERFYRCLRRIFCELNDFSDKTIIEKRNNEYGE